MSDETAQKASDHDPQQDHWLARPRTIRLLWIVFVAVLAVLVLLDLVISKHPKFAIEGSFGFGAWFGFGACVVLVFGSKALGLLMKRPDTYYDD